MTLLDSTTWTGKIHSTRWTEGSDGTITVREPATGETLGAVGAASREDVLAASRAAAAAQKDWAARPPRERAAVLRRAGRLFEEHAEEIRSWIVSETGAIPPKGGLEAKIAADECHEAAALPTHPHGEVLATDEDRWSQARRRPAGVVSVIAPFNFPLILSIRSVAPALALGNAVLLKPDPRTSVSGGVVLARIFEEAGLPEGLLHLLPGGRETGAAVVEAPEARVVAFTGSTEAGRSIGETCARLLKRPHLELGGNNAMIVLPEADLDRAVSAAAFGSFMHQGQICMTTGRHLVHEDIHDDYLERLAAKADGLPVGDPAREQVALGPIIDENQLKRVDSIVQETVLHGGRVVAGGTHEGPFYRPTVLTDLTEESPAWAQEIFGPVAPVMRFRTEEEAIALANGSAYGLSASILGDVGAAMRIADQLASGKIHINEQTVSDEAYAPFGGVGDSGNGSRVGGAAANIESFTELQWLTLRPEIAQYPF
ncbi:benzaldehyde dehydrogenase [Nesterenkonia sp. K-15-9-6]|uniref:benzaldehyde dehydrogenase n=1 Tax=Nesterenkonia sp. K-15-9-6 TaxID=3093918 RepID=UPI00404512AE